MHTISDICDLHEQWARGYYRRATGEPTGTIRNIQDAHRELRTTPDPQPTNGMLWREDGRTLGELPGQEFSGKLLYHVQMTMARKELSRRTVDDRIAWIKRMFSWACGPEQELLPETVFERLTLVKPLKRGRSPARETKPKRSVPFDHIRATATYGSQKLAVMIMVHWWTGMRPDELCSMHVDDIDRTASDWVYLPSKHKREHHGLPRVIPIGPKARELLQPWLAALDSEWVFPGRWPARPICRNSYYQLVREINELYGLDSWCPSQIRKAFATRVERLLTDKDAQVLLDHSSVATTRKYYIDPVELARKIELMRRVG